MMNIEAGKSVSAPTVKESSDEEEINMQIEETVLKYYAPTKENVIQGKLSDFCLVQEKNEFRYVCIVQSILEEQ